MATKKRFFRTALGLATMLILALVAWAALPAPARADTQACVAGPHHGTISADQTWCLADSPHFMDGSVQIASGVTVTIQPGVEVRVQGMYYLEALDGASLLAQGTADLPITFTSAAPSPQPGDWANLWINGTARVRLDYVDIANGGGGWNRGLYLESSDAEVRNSHIHDNVGDGVFMTGASVGAVLESVQIDHNSWRGVYQERLDSIPSYHNLTFSDNAGGALVIGNGDVSNRDVTLDGSPAALNGAPAVFTSNIIVYDGRTLTVAPGSVVQMAGHYYVQANAGGTLLAQGTAGQPITFTSAATTPQPGDWSNVWLYAGAHAHLEYVDIGYAGYGWDRGLHVESSDVEVRNSRIHDGVGDGVFVAAGSVGAVLDGVQIDHNTWRGVYQQRLDSIPSYHNMTLTDNPGGALVLGNGDVSNRSVTLDSSPAALNGAPAVFLSHIIVYAGKTLTVVPGSVVQMAGHYYVEVEADGTLLAQGTAGQRTRLRLRSHDTAAR